jgi:hypothetical protein
MTSIQSLLSSQVDADVCVVATPRRRVASTRRVDVSAADASDASTLAAFFALPVRQVQKMFGMSEGAFTRAFRSAGIPRWPYRRVRALLAAAERPSTTSDERAMLLHEYDFLLRNTELLGLSVASEKRAVVRSVVPLPPAWPPLRAPVSEPTIASLENAHSASKVVRRRAAAGKRGQRRRRRRRCVGHGGGGGGCDRRRSRQRRRRCRSHHQQEGSRRRRRRAAASVAQVHAAPPPRASLLHRCQARCRRAERNGAQQGKEPGGRVLVKSINMLQLHVAPMPCHPWA